MDFVDPVWKAIVKDYRGFKGSIFTEASSLNRDHKLSGACLNAAKKHGVMTDNDSFRFACMGDENLLYSISQVWFYFFPFQVVFLLIVSYTSYFFCFCI